MSDYADVKEWAEAGRALAAVHEKDKWGIADWLLTAERRGFESKYKLAALILHFSSGTCRNYAYVARTFPTAAERNDVVTFCHHQAVAALPAPDRQRLLALAERNLSVPKLRVEVRKVQRAASNTCDGLFPPGMFKVLYADPPWQHNPESSDWRHGNGAPEDHYQTMPLDEICNMGLPVIADDAVLFMWAVSPLLPEAFKVLGAWGFKCKAQFIWDKIKPNIGCYNWCNHEILLIATKGSCSPEPTARVDSVVVIERTEHSRKPEYFRELIDAMYPSGNRIELFARGRLPAGWAGWGNEFDPTPLVEEGPFASAAQVEAYIRDTA